VPCDEFDFAVDVDLVEGVAAQVVVVVDFAVVDFAVEDFLVEDDVVAGPA
jgi:hypothetical protein